MLIAQPYQATTFVDVTDAAGVACSHSTTQTILQVEDLCDCMDETPVMNADAEIMASWITGGVAAGDYDGDGWTDLYVVGGDAGSNRLFRNLGNKTFEDVTASTAAAIEDERTTGPVFVDYDGDGDLDLFLGGVLDTPPRLLRSDRLPDDSVVFTNVWTQAFSGFDAKKTPVTWGPAFADYDRDGDLDAFLPHSMLPPGPILDPATTGSTQHLWRNDGDGTFTDVSIEAGISSLFGVENAAGESLTDQTFSPNFVDLDEDGWLDLVVAGDKGTSRVLLNQRDGSFHNATDGDVITGRTAMGTAIGDFDNDGHFDWFVSHVRFADVTSGNRLYRGHGNGTFTDVTSEAGVRNGHWGWGGCFADFDNDGHLDIFHVNGFYHVPNNIFIFGGEWTNTPAVLFRSNGDGTFTERAADMGLSEAGEGRGVSCFDYDRDGDVDLAVSNHRGAFRLWENVDGNADGFLRVDLVGRAPNTRGVGARVSLESTGPGSSLPPQLRLVRAGNNFVSSDPPELLFGLAKDVGPFRLTVNWMDGSITQRPDIDAGSSLVIRQCHLAVSTTYAVGGGLVLDGEAEDPEGNDVSSLLRWSQGTLGNVVATGPSVNLTTLGLETGLHTMFLSLPPDTNQEQTYLPFEALVPGCIPDCAVFSDGFESGDTSAWQ